MDASPRISPEDEMKTLLSRLPGARRALFAAFHIGGCQSCAYQDDESLASVCARNEIPVDEAIAYLLKSHEHDQEMLVAPADLKSRLDGGESVLLVDTRTREEHEAVSLPGSRLMTRAAALRSQGVKLPDDSSPPEGVSQAASEPQAAPPQAGALPELPAAFTPADSPPAPSDGHTC